MTFRGVIRDGVIIVPESVELPNGTEVDIQPRRAVSKQGRSKAIPGKSGRAEKTGRDRKGKVRRGETLADRLQTVIGKAKGLPADASRNIDHYLYGAPKR